MKRMIRIEVSTSDPMYGGEEMAQFEDDLKAFVKKEMGGYPHLTAKVKP